MALKLTKKQIKQMGQLALARKDFWSYCNLLAPDFYKKDRIYLKEICHSFQEFMESDDEIMIFNGPPRHGKTRTVSLLTSWIFGEDQTKKVMTGSYNETLSTTLSKSVRNTIMQLKASDDIPVYSDVFPNVFINHGDGAMNLWSLNGGYNNYLATSPRGIATGFGADIIIIDDLIKLALEANDDSTMEAHWSWFTDTILSRLEEGGKIILVMTRWSTKDLAGRVLEWCIREKKKYRHLVYKAHQGNGKMLCPEIMSYQSYISKKSAMSPEIVSANYDQIPIDARGRLYSGFQTYERIPLDVDGRPLFTAVAGYVDTADTGSDYLCQIIYGVYQGRAYVLDVYYTKKPMEITEEETARRLIKHKAREVDIESNNGGYGFARQVKKHLQASGSTCAVNTFTQTKNKKARILSNASAVMQNVLFPVGWHDLWPEYYLSMSTYQRTGKNSHDDAQDATTGIVERMEGTTEQTADLYDAVLNLGL